MGRQPKIHEHLPFSFDEVLTKIAKTIPTSDLLAVKPFVKWVGGKRSIINELKERLPNEYNSYYEPFVGGGALYFAVQPKKAYLSDVNFHLIITYRAIQQNIDAVITQLKQHKAKHCKEYYLQARVKLNNETDCVKIASLFIYINKTCFNGLYRVNKSGGFNVPMGGYKNPTIVDIDNLTSVNKVLQNITIVHHSFAKTPINKGDFYYLDPPYHETYSGYASGGFDDDKHIKLANFCYAIHEKGGYFMLSNSDNDFIKNLYRAYNIENVSALRSVSCKSVQRGRTNECVIRNYE